MKTFEQFDEHDPFGEEVESRNIPHPIEPEHINPRDLIELQRMAIEYVTRCYEGEEPDIDYAQYMFESVVQMFYGNDIFQKIRELKNNYQNNYFEEFWRNP